MLGWTRQSISKYYETYCKEGIAGLEIEYSPGKPPRLTDEQQNRLADVFEDEATIRHPRYSC